MFLHQGAALTFGQISSEKSFATCSDCSNSLITLRKNFTLR